MSYKYLKTEWFSKIYIFGKQYVFLSWYIILTRTFLIPRKIQGDVATNVLKSSSQISFILWNCGQNWIFLKGFCENSQNEISWKYAQRLAIRSTQADNEQNGGQTGTAELKATFRNFANAPKISITGENLFEKR